MEDHVHPYGWLDWNKSALGLGTLYYDEYKNSGPGAALGQRVKWHGHRVMNFTEASKFTIGRFILGSSCLSSMGIPFYVGLSK